MAVPSPPMLPFIDLAAQRARLGVALEEAILRVVRHGQYILGPEVAALERELSAFCGASHVVTCSNGTDALALVLMAKGVKPGDAILCPSFTFAATAEVIAWLGAVPVFVDISPESFNMDTQSLAAGVETAKGLGLPPVGVMPVDLFGLPADYDEISQIAEQAGLWILCDAAQSFGAAYRGAKVGTLGDITTTSFFPAKPLGCYGDGGAVFTEDEGMAMKLRSLRVHGQNKTDKYDNIEIGMNGRLDTMQAAVLLQKLSIFSSEIEARGQVAARYSAALSEVCATPEIPNDVTSAWAQYTIRTPANRRDALAAALRAAGVPTAIYYPKPLHMQTAYAKYPTAGGEIKITEEICKEVISLPMHPYLQENNQDKIIESILDFFENCTEY